MGRRFEPCRGHRNIEKKALKIKAFLFVILFFVPNNYKSFLTLSNSSFIFSCSVYKVKYAMYSNEQSTSFGKRFIFRKHIDLSFRKLYCLNYTFYKKHFLNIIQWHLKSASCQFTFEILFHLALYKMIMFTSQFFTDWRGNVENI